MTRDPGGPDSERGSESESSELNAIMIMTHWHLTRMIMIRVIIAGQQIRAGTLRATGSDLAWQAQTAASESLRPPSWRLGDSESASDMALPRPVGRRRPSAARAPGPGGGQDSSDSFDAVSERRQ